MLDERHLRLVPKSNPNDYCFYRCLLRVVSGNWRSDTACRIKSRLPLIDSQTQAFPGRGDSRLQHIRVLQGPFPGEQESCLGVKITARQPPIMQTPYVPCNASPVYGGFRDRAGGCRLAEFLQP